MRNNFANETYSERDFPKIIMTFFLMLLMVPY